MENNPTLILMKFITRCIPPILAILLFTSCHSNKVLPLVSKGKTLQQSVEQSDVFSGLNGFILMDQSNQKVLYEKNADTYFTPASNTKILTLYTALNILSDGAPALKYAETTQGTLHIQGTGHPGLLNAVFNLQRDTVLGFLQQQKRPITFCTCNFQDEKYGSGWSWDDFYYYFQTEKSPLPIYSNNVLFSKRDTLVVRPNFFKGSTTIQSDSTIKKVTISRNWDDNNFTTEIPLNNSFTKRDRPFRTNPNTIAQLLSDTLGIAVKNCNNICTEVEYQKIKSNIPMADLYKELMHPSDNFIAEQLLLLCSNQLFDTLNVARTIEWAQDSLFEDLPQEAKWVDGSGLSRYNLLTPRSIASVLQKLYEEVPEKQLFDLFPTGGETGTIKNWYGGLERPYVFAKTGTLRHIHCLSGYLITRSGKRLVFSFMHNNYVGSMRDLKKEIEKILQLICAEY